MCSLGKGLGGLICLGRVKLGLKPGYLCCTPGMGWANTPSVKNDSDGNECAVHAIHSIWVFTCRHVELPPCFFIMNPRFLLMLTYFFGNCVVPMQHLYNTCALPLHH